ncbi:hypothetical protein GCM10018779_67510 [Streptomyces griseocarneus]|nr:hypothetical protein GCM10018779_67510 [Streptomyces griseocarneus]
MTVERVEGGGGDDADDLHRDDDQDGDPAGPLHGQWTHGSAHAARGRGAGVRAGWIGRCHEDLLYMRNAGIELHYQGRYKPTTRLAIAVSASPVTLWNDPLRNLQRAAKHGVYMGIAAGRNHKTRRVRSLARLSLDPGIKTILAV